MFLEVQNQPAFFFLMALLYFLTSPQVGVEAESWHGEIGTLQSKTPSQFLTWEPGSQPEITTVGLLTQGLDKCSAQPERLSKFLLLKTFSFLPDR